MSDLNDLRFRSFDTVLLRHVILLEGAFIGFLTVTVLNGLAWIFWRETEITVNVLVASYAAIGIWLIRRIKRP